MAARGGELAGQARRMLRAEVQSRLPTSDYSFLQTNPINTFKISKIEFLSAIKNRPDFGGRAKRAGGGHAPATIIFSQFSLSLTAIYHESAPLSPPTHPVY
jgi:hypothetical protein